MKPLELDDNAAWKQRFRAPYVASAVVAARDRRQGVILWNVTGRFQLYDWGVPNGSLEQLTERPDGVAFHHLGPAGQYVYYLDDDKGNELGHVVRIATRGGPVEDLTPDLPPFSLAGFDISRNGRVIAFTAGTPAGFHLYSLSAGAGGELGAPQLLYHSRPLLMGPVLSADGALAVVMTTAKTGTPDYALYAFDAHSGEQVGELWDGDGNRLWALQFSPVAGDERVLARSNQSGHDQLLLWEPRTGERVDLMFEELPGTTSAYDWSTDGKRLLLQHFAQAVQQLYVYDLETNELRRLHHPSGSYSSAFFMPEGEIFVLLQDAQHKSRLLALDEETGHVRREVLPAPDAPVGRPWRSVTFSSQDGQTVQAWLATPAGEAPFPTIINMIGGPGGVQTESFSPQAQSWLDHGIAWLSINYRGCATFGRDFQRQIYGDLGHWEVEDIVAARAWLISEGIADPERILLTGWSYGGYLTLMSLSKYPDLWAGGMAGIAIADWAVQYEDSAELLRGYQVALLGGTPDEVPERYAISSPITYAEAVQAPLVIIQGRNDTRTPARPVEIYEQKMRALGKDIAVHWFETGHAGSGMDVELAIEHQQQLLMFAKRVLS